MLDFVNPLYARRSPCLSSLLSFCLATRCSVRFSLRPPTASVFQRETTVPAEAQTYCAQVLAFGVRYLLRHANRCCRNNHSLLIHRSRQILFEIDTSETYGCNGTECCIAVSGRCLSLSQIVWQDFAMHKEPEPLPWNTSSSASGLNSQCFRRYVSYRYGIRSGSK